MKVVFETIGMEGTIRADVPNCRIGTTCNDRGGRLIYIEITGHPSSKHIAPRLQHYTNVGWINHLFYVREDRDERIPPELYPYYKEMQHFEYTKKNIIKLLNRLSVDCTELEFKPDHDRFTYREDI